MRKEFLWGAVIIIVGEVLAWFFLPAALWSFVLFGPLLILGFYDFFQTKRTVRRNFPILGRFRYWFEAIRPEINQYFVESNTDGAPFGRENRSVVYQRAKNVLDTLPFGTQRNVYEVGYEWVNHSMVPAHLEPADLRITIGGPDCKAPYSASLLNISAMSFGALSANAVLALNGAARDGHFAHNTGEGGVSLYHLKPGGDLIWQIGTGYFGCRTKEGGFCEQAFAEKATGETVKMIEIKLSQGAKPGHGGILPAKKVTREISEIRGVPMGVDVISPPAHTAFATPIEMMGFITRLRELSGGKPVGFKLCLGRRREFLALCKAMVQTGVTPDYIAVDGGEGGTGAAPLEFSNHVGTPGVEGLIFVHNALVGFSLRDRIRVLTTGKVTTAFNMVKLLAMGADGIYAARAMMLALGCIQALRCNNNACPTGVATQNPHLVAGLVVSDKRTRVAEYHKETINSLTHIVGAMGLTSCGDLRPWHLHRRISAHEIANYSELYEFVEDGALLDEAKGTTYRAFKHCLAAAQAESFQAKGSN